MTGLVFSDPLHSPFTAKTRWIAIVVILLVAFAFRMLAITDVPPGLTHDEVAQLDVAIQIQRGDWRLLYAGSYGVEPAYHFMLSTSLSLWGENPLARRLPAIFAGMASLACCYVLAARLFGRWAGLGTLAVMSVVWWPVVMSRVVLREVLQVPLYALALYGLWRGIDQARDNRFQLKAFVFGGVALGAAQYVYTIPRGLFIAVTLFGLYLWIVHRPVFRQTWRGLLIMVIVAEGIAAPLLVTAAQQSDVDRLPLDVFSQPDAVLAILDRLQTSIPWILGQFAFTGDTWWHFNIAYRPIFEPFGAALFSLGILVALRWARRPPYAFVLIVLAVSLTPSIVLDPNFPFTRMISAQAVTFVFVVLGLKAVGAGLARILSSRTWVAAMSALAGGLFAINIVNTAHSLFVVWPNLPATRSTYNAELRDLGHFLDTQVTPLPIAQCTLWIVFPFDPQYHHSVAQAAWPYFTARRDLDVRWHDCRYSLVLPASGQFIYGHSDLQPLSDFLGRPLRKPWFDHAQPLSDVSGALYLDTRADLEHMIAEWGQLPVTWPPEVNETALARLPINFDHKVELIGYRLRPGDNVRVVTHWRVLAALPPDLIVFSHLYHTPTEVMAQQDQLDVATEYLMPGDVFIQLHDFIAVPPETPAGSYWIGVGLYQKDTGERLPIWIGDRRAGDRIFLGRVPVER